MAKKSGSRAPAKASAGAAAAAVGGPATDSTASPETQFFSDPGHLRAVLDILEDGLLIVDSQGTVRLFNRACERLFGYRANEVIGRNVKMLVPEAGRDDHDQRIRTYLETGKPDLADVRREVTGVRKDGADVPVSIAIADATVDGGRYFIALVHDLSREKELARKATVDSLTGMLNRRAFIEKGTDEIGRGARYGRPLSVLMLDIDHFKRINDTHGHAAGDEALRRFADACRELLRGTDVPGRVGGEEFAIILPETAAAGAAVLAERLRRRIAALDIASGEARFAMTVSIGVAEWRAEDDIAALLARADSALYAAKKAGRDRIVQADAA